MLVCNKHKMITLRKVGELRHPIDRGGHLAQDDECVTSASCPFQSNYSFVPVKVKARLLFDGCLAKSAGRGTFS